MKKLYLLSQNKNNEWDTYDSCVVCAESEDEARKINPNSSGEEVKEDDIYSGWTTPKNVKVEEIGIANDNIVLGSVICASFNAG